MRPKVHIIPGFLQRLKKIKLKKGHQMIIAFQNGKFYIQLVKRTQDRSTNVTDSLKKHYVIKTHVAIE